MPAQAIQIAAHGDGTGQGLQTLTMSNATQAPGSGATILQYAQDGQFFIPGKPRSGLFVLRRLLTLVKVFSLPQSLIYRVDT